MKEQSLARRRLLRTAGAVSLPLIAGCTGGGPTGNGSGANETEPTEEPDPDEPDEPEEPAENEENEETEPPERHAEIEGVAVHRKEYDLVDLDHDGWPQYGEDRILPPYCEYPNAAAVDEEIPDLRINTVTLYDVENDEGHHPLRTSRTAMRLIHCYRDSGDDRYLDKAETIAAALVEAGFEQDGALYVPYGYDWGNPDGSRHMRAPWVSGMAQGTVLTVFSHLYEVTDEEEYRETADAIFRSFTNVQQVASDDWATIASPLTEMPGDEDEPDYFWVEEYPVEPPQHVLNGFVVGLFGLYDYWHHVDSEAGYDPLCAALTTVEDNIEAYRVPDEVSWYDLAEAYRGNTHYHSTHINQLRLLADLSGESYFEEMAETFDSDSAYEEYRPERRD